MPLVVASALSLAPGSSHLVQQYLLSLELESPPPCSCCTLSASVLALALGMTSKTAEAKRSRRLGKARLSSWAADAPNRKTQVDAANRKSQMPAFVVEEPEEIDE